MKLLTQQTPLQNEGVDLKSKREIVHEEIAPPITISITSDVLKTLKSEDLDINQLFILLALYKNNISILDIYDNDNADKEVLIFQYQKLYIHGFIESHENDENLYRLTSKGKLFIEEILPFMEGTPDSIESKSEFKDLCKSYLEIFPKIKLPSGKYARANIVEIEKKMKTFIHTYKSRFRTDYGFVLTHDDILQATKIYVERFSKVNYNFMVTSSYFIQKNEKSALADEIVALKQGLNKQKTNITSL